MVSRSRKGAWIEILVTLHNQINVTVAPVRERGLKSISSMRYGAMVSRSRKGAWIEILVTLHNQINVTVAPVRERGLKSHGIIYLESEVSVAPVRERGLKFPIWVRQLQQHRRSRKGAWIEMTASEILNISSLSRSRKGAWIEMPIAYIIFTLLSVAPVRERGLKSTLSDEFIQDHRRSRKGAWIEITKFDMYWPTFASLP